MVAQLGGTEFFILVAEALLHALDGLFDLLLPALQGADLIPNLLELLAQVRDDLGLLALAALRLLNPCAELLSSALVFLLAGRKARDAGLDGRALAEDPEDLVFAKVHLSGIANDLVGAAGRALTGFGLFPAKGLHLLVDPVLSYKNLFLFPARPVNIGADRLFSVLKVLRIAGCRSDLLLEDLDIALDLLAHDARIGDLVAGRLDLLLQHGQLLPAGLVVLPGLRIGSPRLCEVTQDRLLVFLDLGEL